jgi:two-component system LytT family sensor kinase
MGELLNLIGLSTGVVLYAMLLSMVVRAGRVPGLEYRFDPLLVATSVLGLVWNLCALSLYELPKLGVAGRFPWLSTVGFSALGFLPAVVVHSVLRGERAGVQGRLKRTVVAGAYLASAAASLMHVTAAWQTGDVPSAEGMRLLTYAFVSIVIPLGAMTRRQPGARRAVWVAALAAFAVSALHLSQLHGGDPSWPVELLGHHASIPLALAILYQDYPFALADLFLKRALTFLALVASAFFALATFGSPSSAFDERGQLNPRQVGLFVTMWVATALLYPALGRAISWFVDTVVLRRPDYRLLRTTAARLIQAHESIPDLLSDIAALLAPAMSARAVDWSEIPSGIADDMASGILLAGDRAQQFSHRLTRQGAKDEQDGQQRVAALVFIACTETPRYVLVVSELTGGRRLLSDDLSTLESLAVLLARRIDAIRITRERYERELREQEIAKLATEAELRALRAQVNPHFLFNTLTTIGYLIQAAPTRALDTLMRLTLLLRGVLRSEGEFTTLERELEIIESYLDIERERFEDRLRVRIDVPAALRSLRLPPLLLQPLVENAIKHGIGPLAEGGEVFVSGRLEHPATDSPELSLIVRDTGCGATASQVERGRSRGVGLRNVERRLLCHYGSAASLSIGSAPGRGTTVSIRLPADFSVIHEQAARNTA